MKSRFFFVIYSAGNLGLILYGLMALLRPSILLEPFTQHIYAFPTEDSTALGYLVGLFRLLGFFNLLLGALGLFLLLRFQFKPQAWLLLTVVASTLLTYFVAITFDNTVGKIGVFEVIEHVLFGLMVVAGVVMVWLSRHVDRKRNEVGV